MKYTLTSLAETEYSSGLAYYDEQSPSAASGFVREVEEALPKIADAPHRYPVISEEVRVKRLHRYPYSIFYSISEDEVLILSIHADSKLPHWQS